MFYWVEEGGLNTVLPCIARYNLKQGTESSYNLKLATSIDDSVYMSVNWKMVVILLLLIYQDRRRRKLRDCKNVGGGRCSVRISQTHCAKLVENILFTFREKHRMWGNKIKGNWMHKNSLSVMINIKYCWLSAKIWLKKYIRKTCMLTYDVSLSCFYKNRLSLIFMSEKDDSENCWIVLLG